MDPRPVVFIGAHPDDITTAAGTLALLAERGHPLHDFCLTRGQRGVPAWAPEKTAVVRTKEEEAVCALLGAELTFFDEMDGELYANAQICRQVADALARIKPAAVITGWALEKPDHAAVCGITHKALYLADLTWTTELYLTNFDADLYHFMPNLYVNITRTIDTKRAIARCYPSQFSASTADDLADNARHHGRQAWCDYAEPYYTAMALVGTRWNRPAEIGRLLLDL